MVAELAIELGSRSVLSTANASTGLAYCPRRKRWGRLRSWRRYVNEVLHSRIRVMIRASILAGCGDRSSDTKSELGWHVRRQRSLETIRQKASRGELWLLLPVSLVRRLFA